MPTPAHAKAARTGDPGFAQDDSRSLDFRAPLYNSWVPELTPAHVAILERLVVQGFTPVAFPMYASAMGVRRGSFAALLAPADEAALKMMGEPCYVIGANLAVRMRRDGRPVFVWKDKSVEATPALLDELAHFSAELSALLKL